MNSSLVAFCYRTLDTVKQKFSQEKFERLEYNLERIANGKYHKDHESHLDLQDPQFCYYAGLTDKPWWDLELAPKSDIIRYKEKIKKELSNFLESLNNDDGFEPVEKEEIETEIPSTIRSKYMLLQDYASIDVQSKYSERQKFFPYTMEFVQSIPFLADDVFFSCLEPHTHLGIHSAESNVRLNVHLGICIPSNSAISVAGEIKIWPDDGLLCFDPSFSHEAWNKSNEYRYILLFTIWHPDLSPGEIEFMKIFTRDHIEYM